MLMPLSEVVKLREEKYKDFLEYEVNVLTMNILIQMKYVLNTILSKNLD